MARADAEARVNSCAAELSGKLAMTREQAQRLALSMSPAEREEVGATGNVDMEKFLRLAVSRGIEVNDAKAKEKQGALQKFRVMKEIERDLPAHERGSAATKAANMSPATISQRMTQPKTKREPAETRDLPPLVKYLEKTLVPRLEQRIAELEAALYVTSLTAPYMGPEESEDSRRRRGVFPAEFRARPAAEEAPVAAAA
jgi:hypothetical protein